MSKEAAEHHRKAAGHHEHAAQHHREAAKHHEAGDHERGAPRAHDEGRRGIALLNRLKHPRKLWSAVDRRARSPLS